MISNIKNNWCSINKIKIELVWIEVQIQMGEIIIVKLYFK